MSSNGFYPQCGLTIKGAVAYDDAADDTTVLTGDDYSTATAATFVCGKFHVDFLFEGYQITIFLFLSFCPRKYNSVVYTI